MTRSPFARSQRMPILLGILCLVMIIVVMQLWLFTASMEAYLGGDETMVVPAAVASLGCFGLVLGLLHYARTFEH